MPRVENISLKGKKMKIIHTRDYILRLLCKDLEFKQYLHEFRDKAKFLALCKECPNYEKSWSCPPFIFDAEELLNQYSRIHIIVSQFTPTRCGFSMNDFRAKIKPECIELENKLLSAEPDLNGHVFATIGKCLYCGEQECRRVFNQPCLHPDKVRPSLEAYGFDLSRTVKDLFGIELKWGSSNDMPEYLVFVTGMFHNNSTGISIID